MKISALNNYNRYQNNLFERKNTANDSASYILKQNFSPLPSTKNFLAFTGGYSLSLKETVQNLDENSFPPDIRENAIEVLNNGNPENKTLINIHREKYGKINRMKSLDEVKAEFPEFKDVLSDKEAVYKSNSFIDDVKNGKLEWFDPDVDLTLQLLQMYWADGFSYNDLKEYSDGKNIGKVFEKLNIPRLDKNYARVLKLSDKKYNKRFTHEMSKRRQGIKYKRTKQTNTMSKERAPLTEKHKKRISEGLIKYYAKHPEKLTEASLRLKEYWENHPKEKENFSNVLTNAWSLKEARSIRKKMSKFMGKKDISPEEFANLNFSKNEDGQTLGDFWKKNVWAKAQWSKCMKIAWENMKTKEATEEDTIYSIDMYPSSLQKDIRRWMRKEGYDLSKLEESSFQALITVGDKEPPKSENYEYINGAITNYFSQPGNVNIMADMLQIALFKTAGEISTGEISLSSKDLSYKNGFINTFARDLLDENCAPKEIETNKMIDIYIATMLRCKHNKENEAAKAISRNLEDSYMILKNKDNKSLNAAVQKGLLATQTSMTKFGGKF